MKQPKTAIKTTKKSVVRRQAQPPKQTPKQTPKKAAPTPSPRKIPGPRLQKLKGTASAAPLVNHVAFVIDRSGSMAPIAARVVSIINNQILKLKQLQKTSKQQTVVSVVTFSTAADKPRIHQVPVAGLRPLRSLRCTGMTALFDGTGQAIDALRVGGAEASRAHAFLVVVLTDGHENSSQRYRHQLPKMILSRQKTGRWTFAFLVPAGGVAACQRLGIPADNVSPWTTTSAGVEAMGRALNRSVERFYAARGRGEGCTLHAFGKRKAGTPA